MLKSHILFDHTKTSKKIKNFLDHKIKNISLVKCNLIIVIGGDGFMLSALKKYNKYKKPFYGINAGNYGFLMNKFSSKNTVKNLSKAKSVTISPLEMIVKNKYNKIKKSIAINEVSILRQSRQAASISIFNGSKTIIKNLVSDGVLVSTPAGSTAYNMSVHGPILSLDSKKLSVSPISAFRPRRWKGAILNNESNVKFEIIESMKRPVSVVADSTEFRDIKSVEVHQSKDQVVELLFDEDHSFDERILNEQFKF